MQINFKDYRDKASSMLERACLFGDGFFTTGLIQNGKINHLSAHLDRLSKSAQHFKFNPLNREALNERLQELAKPIGQASFRLTVTRTQQARGYAISPQQEMQLDMTIADWQPSSYQTCESFFAATPISSNSALAGFKHLNRLDNVLAASEITRADQEALMCLGDQVICGSRSNLFVFFNGHWLTPIIEKAGILGITRQRIIQSAKQQGLFILEREISRTQLLQSEAAFVSNSLLGIWPIAKIEDKSLDTQLCSDLQSRLNFSI